MNYQRCEDRPQPGPAPHAKQCVVRDLRPIASRTEVSARKAADMLGIPVAYGSFEALLADPGIEAIYNPIPNHLRVPLTLPAVAVGKHVLCEKSIALNAEEAEHCARRRPRL